MKKAISPIFASPVFWVILSILILLIALTTSGFNVNIGEPGVEKFKVKCDVHIHDYTFTGPAIQRFDCNKVGECGLFSFSAKPFWFWENKGYIKLVMDDDEYDTQYYEIFFVGGDEDVELEVCTTSTHGRLKLFDEENKILDTKEVNV